MTKRRIAETVRLIVEARANSICEYCRCPSQLALQAFECEHIVPYSKGGTIAVDNLAWACGGCNRFKAARTSFIDIQSGQDMPLFNPREEDWNKHFAWGSDFSEMVGLTAIGRATIIALRLNRVGVVNLRKLLVVAGMHPPT